jgi:uncharacterized protein with HEPN domain
MSLKSKDRLKHILRETEYLLSLSPNLKVIEDLSNDETLKRATRASLETIGEAVKGIPKVVQDLSPSTEWNKIARTRDNLIHRYHDVNYQLIFKIIKENIPTLNRKITSILNQINRKEYLEYQNLIAPKGIDTSTFLIKIDNQEKLDVAIAKAIRDKYPKEYQNVAIAEVRDIIGAGDRATELKNNSESITSKEYVTQIINKSMPQQQN